jgi:uncharacterized protein DUF4386
MPTALQPRADSTSPKGTADARFPRAAGGRSDPDGTGRSPAASVRPARTAGLLYLVLAIFGAFAQIVRVKVYEPGNAAATAANLVSHATQVRLSFVADLVQALTHREKT